MNSTVYVPFVKLDTSIVGYETWMDSVNTVRPAASMILSCPGASLFNRISFPQGRVLRLELQDDSLNQKLDSFYYNGLKVTNFEMETSAIYGLSKLLGHQACSMNAILANRALGTFSKNPQETINKLIIYTLNKLIS